MEDRRKRAPDDPEQSSRFVQLGRTIVADGESNGEQDKFGTLIKQIAPVKTVRTPRKKAVRKPRGKDK